MAPPDGPDPLDVEEHPFGGAAIGTAPIGAKPTTDADVAIQHGEIAVAGQSITFEYAFAVTPAQLAFAGQAVLFSTPELPIQHGELAVAGQSVTFEITFNIEHAEVAFAGQGVTYEGLLNIEHGELAVEGQAVPLSIDLSISHAEIVVEGQVAFSIIDTMPVTVGAVVFEVQELSFLLSVKPIADRYYYCARTGFRVPLRDLVEDGRRPGMYVQRGWDDDIHPQEWLGPIGGDGRPYDRSAPPQDPVEEYEQVILTIDGEQIEV